jgi:hypothetical protein
VASGVLATPVSSTPGEYLLWFRPERLHTVTWGGNPFKPMVIGDTPADLSPRRSFAQWHQLVERTSDPWTPADLAVYRAAGRAVLNVHVHNPPRTSECITMEISSAGRLLNMRQLQPAAKRRDRTRREEAEEPPRRRGPEGLRTACGFHRRDGYRLSCGGFSGLRRRWRAVEAVAATTYRRTGALI